MCGESGEKVLSEVIFPHKHSLPQKGSCHQMEGKQES